MRGGGDVVFEDLEDFHDDDEEEGPSAHRDGEVGEDSMEGFDREHEMEMDDFIVDEAMERRPNHQQRQRRDRKMTAAYQEALRVRTRTPVPLLQTHLAAAGGS